MNGGVNLQMGGNVNSTIPVVLSRDIKEVDHI